MLQQVLMLLPSMSMLYSTHILMESLNLAVVVLVAMLGMHSIQVVSRALYGSNLYLELVWLLTPTAAVVLLIVRTVGMQCSDEELR